MKLHQSHAQIADSTFATSVRYMLQMKRISTYLSHAMSVFRNHPARNRTLSGNAINAPFFPTRVRQSLVRSVVVPVVLERRLQNSLATLARSWETLKNARNARWLFARHVHSTRSRACVLASRVHVRRCKRRRSGKRGLVSATLPYRFPLPLHPKKTVSRKVHRTSEHMDASRIQFKSLRCSRFQHPLQPQCQYQSFLLQLDLVLRRGLLLLVSKRLPKALHRMQFDALRNGG